MIGTLLTALALFAQDGGAARVLVVTGLSGEAQYAKAFTEFGQIVVDAARQRWGLPDSAVVYLAENPTVDPQRISGKATKDAVLSALARFATETRPDDVVLVVLAGHGSEQSETPRLSLPGPDLTADDLATAFSAFQRQTVVLVNTASASGGFIKPLAGPRRVVITATKSSFERNATMFGGFFAKALAGDEADADKNGRISIAEAYQYARREVIRSYESANRLLTEHSQLDDDGDGVGSADLAAGGDGAVARLISFSLSKEEAPSDPKVASLVAERRRLENAIAALRGRKSAMDSTGYERELERLLLELARVNQTIRNAREKP